MPDNLALRDATHGRRDWSVNSGAGAKHSSPPSVLMSLYGPPAFERPVLLGSQERLKYAFRTFNATVMQNASKKSQRRPISGGLVLA